MEPRRTGTGWISRRASACAAVAIAAVTLPFVHAAEAATTPTVSVDDASVIEGDSGTSFLQFHVTLDQAADTTTSVHFRTTTAGTATVGTDFDSLDVTLTFLTGATNATLSVPVHGDVVGEPDETVGVELYDPTGLTIAPDAVAVDPVDPSVATTASTVVPGAEALPVPSTDVPEAAADGQGIGTITNDDPIPAVSVDDASVTEGDSGLTAIAFHVTLDQPSKDTVSVKFRTTTGSAATGTDYEPADLTVTFLPGAVSATINVTVHGDTTFEGDEQFGAQLSNPVGVTIADGTGTGTILDDDPDPSPPAANIADAQVVEGDNGTATMTFAVTLSETSRRPVTVTATTSNGSATSGTDYTANSTTLTFPPNTTGPQYVSVDVTGDDEVEPDETFDVTLSSPEWATLGDATATGTIANDDAEVGWAVTTASVSEGPTDSTQTVELTAVLSAPLPTEVSIPITTVAHTATEGVDYQQLPLASVANFPAGNTSATILVKVNGDNDDEPDETFSVILGDPPADRAAFASTTGAEAVVTIVDDDAPTTTTIDTTTTTTIGSEVTTPPTTSSADSSTSGTGSSSLPTTGSSVGNLVVVALALIGAGSVARRFGLARRSTVG